MKRYKSPAYAERHYFPSPPLLEPRLPLMTDISIQTGVEDLLLHAEAETQTDRIDIEALSKYFSEDALSAFGLVIPDDFLVLAAKAMSQLKDSGRTNVVYNLSKGLGTSRQGKKESRFPSNRMPMGLVEHTVNFFVTEANNKVTQLFMCQQSFIIFVIIGPFMPTGL